MKKKILISLTLLVIAVAGFVIGYWLSGPGELAINSDTVTAGGALIGISFDADEKEQMYSGLERNRDAYEKIRKIEIDNSIPPALMFNPVPVGAKYATLKKEFTVSPAGKTELPENKEELAFWSVRDLAYLIKNRKISSLDLTKIYLNRLKKYDKELECVITLTEELAFEQAKRADREIAAGKYRGLLHGIPYGIKDLFAVKNYKTTWGAMPYKEQILDTDAAVVEKLEEAGAVLVAKLTLGALAWGDVWYGGKTRNPWDREQGSSGSSAGPASATSAGLVAFAIGTETWGSIVSPSTRCGVTGLRPTYGRVSRTGAMALSWTMDKVGPICRTVEDCAIVFNAIYGPDGADQTIIDLPFNYNPKIDMKTIRIGYLKSVFDEDGDWKEYDNNALEALKKMGVELIPIELPELPVGSLSFILNAEAAAAFDTLTRSGEDDRLVRQVGFAWPNVFRASRFIPAVEYIQANRVRYMLIQEMEKLFEKVDIYIAPSFGGGNLLLTNLTGHPCVVLPNGFDKDNHPVSISFTGGLFDEATLLTVAKKYQEATGYHLPRPPKFDTF